MKLQYTAPHCNTLQHTQPLQDSFIGIEHIQVITLQHTATHCNTLQHTATHYNTLQHTVTVTVTHCNTHCNKFNPCRTARNDLRIHTVSHCNTLHRQHSATHYNTLHCNLVCRYNTLHFNTKSFAVFVAVRCSVMQCDAV